MNGSLLRQRRRVIEVFDDTLEFLNELEITFFADDLVFDFQIGEVPHTVLNIVYFCD